MIPAKRDRISSWPTGIMQSPPYRRWNKLFIANNSIRCTILEIKNISIFLGKNNEMLIFFNKFTCVILISNMTLLILSFATKLLAWFNIFEAFYVSQRNELQSRKIIQLKFGRNFCWKRSIIPFSGHHQAATAEWRIKLESYWENLKFIFLISIDA